MLEYKTGSDSYKELALSREIARIDLDRVIDEQIKLRILRGDTADLTKLFGRDDPAITEASEQALVLGEVRGIYFDGMTVLPSGYGKAALTPKRLRALPLERRAAVLRGALMILQKLESMDIFPGSINLDAIIYDETMRSDEVFIRYPDRFQLGSFRNTSPAYNLDDNVGTATPYFDPELQKTANTRLAAKLLVTCSDSIHGVTERSVISRVPGYCAELLTSDRIVDTVELLDVCERLISESDRTPVYIPAAVSDCCAVCVVVPPCFSKTELILYNRQLAMINDAAREAALNGEMKKAVYAAFAWCGDVAAESARTGRVYSRGFVPFDGKFLPNIQLMDRRRTETGDFLSAYIAAEAMIRLRTDCRRLLLLILLPPVRNRYVAMAEVAAEQTILELGRETPERMLGVSYLCGEPHTYGGGRAKDNAINTDSPDGCKKLFEMVRSIIAT